MPAPTHDQLKALIQQETDMFDALVEASNDAYIVHRAWRELVLENERLRKELETCVRALAQFAEQPRVLDGDDGLGGEVLHQLDLLVGKGARLPAIDTHGADQLVFSKHGHGQECPSACEPKPLTSMSYFSTVKGSLSLCGVGSKNCRWKS